MMGGGPLPVGKVPVSVLGPLLAGLECSDPRLVVRPGIGQDVAAIEMGDRLLVLKTDPITFTADRIGHYLACVNANDIATAGARPRWCLVTALLPERGTTPDLVRSLFAELAGAMSALGVILCGGHSEVTAGLDRPILVGTMLGEVEKERLVDKSRVRPGDVVLMTRWIPIEGSAIMARELAPDLALGFSPDEVRRAAAFLDEPGICVVAEALAASEAACVHAMHDVTEGGLATGLIELAVATGTGLRIREDRIRIDPLAARLCRWFGLDPLGVISSGTLLVVTDPSDADKVAAAVHATGSACEAIGTLTARPGEYLLVRPDNTPRPLPEFKTDEIARLLAGKA